VEKCVEGPAAAAEGDACSTASIVVCAHVVEAAGVGLSAQASSFAAGDTASGLAFLPSFSPPAYGLLCLQCLHLTAPMHCSMFPGSGVDIGSRACFCFGAFLAPMHSAILGQVF
jgi:hypothetical protein